MTKLLQCLRDELVRRDYAATTIRSYVQIVEAFREHTGARLDRITPAQLRRYHLFLLEKRRLAVGTVVTQICALRFFCRYVLNRRDVREDLPYPKGATAATGRAQSRRSAAAHRAREEPLSPHAPPHALWCRLASQRGVSSEGARHR